MKNVPDAGTLPFCHEKQVMIRTILSRSACTTCPAGLTGTLVAIEGILKAEVDPEIVVITV